MATFHGEESDVDVPECLVHEYVLEHAARRGQRPAFVDGVSGRSFTHAQVAELVQRTAAGLAALGIRRGDVVMLILPNMPEYPILFLGIIRAGGVVTPANPAYTPTELAKQAKDSRARLVVTTNELSSKTAQMQPIPFIVTCDEQPSSPARVPLSSLFQADPSLAPSAATFSPDDVCALPFSSGTTGVAKGVMLTHRNFVANMQQMYGGSRPAFAQDESDTILGLLPMFHIYGTTVINLASLRTGSRVVTLPRFEMELMLETIQREKITLAPLVPPIILALTKLPIVDNYDLSSVRKAISGAAPLDAKLEAAFLNKFSGCIIGQGYGLTESSPVLTVSTVFRKVPGRSVPGSAGVLLPLTEARVVDVDTGRDLPVNKTGELWAKGPQVMLGYLNSLEATRATVTPDGWLRTGDIAYINEQGHVFLVDRAKELIKFKGFQVPPAELEGILLSHPSIADAAVVPSPDAEAGEVPVAFIVRRPQTTSTAKDIQDFVAAQVATYKRLHGVRFVDAIPKSASGKILRRELKARL